MTFRFSYVGIPLAVFAILFLGGMITIDGMDWYNNDLILSSLTPPAWVFRVVWPILGLCTAASLLLFWQAFQHDVLSYSILILFCINGILNAGWSFVFFRMHAIAKAFWVSLALELSLILLILLLWRRHRAAAIFLFPYALWVVFALYLNYDIWLLNEPL